MQSKGINSFTIDNNNINNKYIKLTNLSHNHSSKQFIKKRSIYG